MDKFIWHKNAGRSYTVRDGQAEASKKCEFYSTPIVVTDALASIWNTSVPSKIQVFGSRCVKYR